MTATFPNILIGSIIDPRFGAHAMNANLFDRLERSITELTKPAITTPAGGAVSYADGQIGAGSAEWGLLATPAEQFSEMD